MPEHHIGAADQAPECQVCPLCAGLATLHVDVAGGGAIPQVTDEAVTTAERLLASVVRRGPASAASEPDSGR